MKNKFMIILLLSVLFLAAKDIVEEAIDRWSFPETEYNHTKVIWQGFPRIDVLGDSNQGECVDACRYFDQLQCSGYFNEFQLYWQNNNIFFANLQGERGIGGESLIWMPGKCETLLNSKRGYKIVIWGKAGNTTYLETKGELIDPDTELEYNLSSPENWFCYFLPKTQFIKDALHRWDLDKMRIVKTKNWTAIKLDNEWIIPENSYFHYGDLVVITSDYWEHENFTFTWQQTEEQNYIEDYKRPYSGYFEYSEELDYLPVFIEFGDEVPDEIGIYIDGKCCGAEIVNTKNLFQLRAYMLEEKSDKEVEFYFRNKDSEPVKRNYYRTKRTNFPKEPKLFTGYESEAAFISFDEVPLFYKPLEVINSGTSDIIIKFILSRRAIVDLGIYDIRGEVIKCIMNNTECHQDTKMTMYWDGRNDSGEQVCSGVYFIRMQVGHNVYTEKAVLMK